MFGFPFVTSLIVVMGLVVASSFIINKGMKLKAKNSDQENHNSSTKKSINAPS